MSITAYTGLPGHGKSYGVVDNVIVPCLEQGIEVWTNIPMKSEAVMDRFNTSVVQFDIQDIIDNPDWFQEVFNPGATIILDELWRLWPAGLKANNALDQHKSFLAEHRHMVGDNDRSTEVVFVTQNLSQIAAFARDLVETTFRVVKQSKMGMDKSYRVDVFDGCVTGPSPSMTRRLREIHGIRKQAIYDLYVSHTKGKGTAGDETRTDDRFNILKGASLKVFAVVFVLGSIGVYYAFRSVYLTYNPPEPVVDITLPSDAQASTQEVSVSQAQTQARSNHSDFLSLFDEIYISLNNGYWPDINYRFALVSDDNRSEVSLRRLLTFGYRVQPINQCLVLVSGSDYSGAIMCQSRNEAPGMSGSFGDSVSNSSGELISI